MITKDPFDAENDDSVYISAVCGHNSKVVDNDGLPEQILVNPRSKAVVVMTRSQQKNVLAFAEDGGLEEKQDICSRQGRVLNDIQARALSKVALDIKQAFGGKKEQDIEWGLINGKIYIVQSRPYIEKK
jgi:phosphoenolpyruvate synthase/pyruvate phosphate dikinase